MSGLTHNRGTPVYSCGCQRLFLIPVAYPYDTNSIDFPSVAGGYCLPVKGTGSCTCTCNIHVISADLFLSFFFVHASSVFQVYNHNPSCPLLIEFIKYWCIFYSILAEQTKIFVVSCAQRTYETTCCSKYIEKGCNLTVPFS